MGQSEPAPFRLFEDFWPFYVSRHRRRGTAAVQPVDFPRPPGPHCRHPAQDVCGDAGFFVGRYEARQTSGGEFLPANRTLARASLRRQPEHGNFVLCVKRGDGKAWQIAADMWNDGAQVGILPAAQPGQ